MQSYDLSERMTTEMEDSMHQNCLPLQFGKGADRVTEAPTILLHSDPLHVSLFYVLYGSWLSQVRTITK